ncbi:hypothetical protein DPEC_G00023720 [Dallia pectoralis]|uniref:Uncharacterized protein n=1 Tax=Dallia pectoralis TaxID=75939 RepID=A0ACC2HHU8_DALPE|nr:hypothetical protein DPEC_G00023720 [Dallia pectoralis]
MPASPPLSLAAEPTRTTAICPSTTASANLLSVQPQTTAITLASLAQAFLQQADSIQDATWSYAMEGTLMSCGSYEMHRPEARRPYQSCHITFTSF